MSFLNKAKVAVFVSFIMIFTSLPFAASAERFPFVGVVTANDVNVRTAPSMDAAVESRVNRGILLDVYERSGEWYKIGTSPTTYAYIFAEYVADRNGGLSGRSLSSSGGAAAAELAKGFLGTPYLYGGASPDGFDCSGFVYYIYKQLGYELYRTSNDQLKNGVPVEKSELLPGDIVMFKREGSSYVHHVGIYVGDGMMIHSPQTGDVVKYASIVSGNYNNVYYTARRIIH